MFRLLGSMSRDASEIAIRLGQQAEAVCRTYLSNGRRAGNYWLVGNIHNDKGRSLYVRLYGPPSGPKAAGRWADAATAQYGDLLDIIRHQGQHQTLGAALREARQFLSLPHPETVSRHSPDKQTRCSDDGTVARAFRLFNAGKPIAGTLAETYLAGRCIAVPAQAALRFHPGVYYQEAGATRQAPALLAAVHDNDGSFTAVNRIWVAQDGNGLAHIPTPKKVRGHLLGNAVRFGKPEDILIVGEGIETVLSLKTVRPDIAMAAALTANHLAAFVPPPDIKHLLIARDNDEAGNSAAQSLSAKAREQSIRPCIIVPRAKDFNDDLRQFGTAFLRDRLSSILATVC